MPAVLSRPCSPGWVEPDLTYDERKTIDKNLPALRTVALDEWLDIWTRLSDSGDNHARDTFALTGHYTENGQRLRAQIDLSGCIPTPTDTIQQLSDIDSVIGIILGDFPFLPDAILKYYMVLSPTHTLTADLHIPPIPVTKLNGEREDMHLHKIPNTRFMEMKPEGLVRIFFPFCELDGGGVCMDRDHMRDFYEKALYLAALETLPEDLIREWPARLSDEWFRGGSRKGNTDKGGAGKKIQQTARDVHAQYLNAWIAKVRDYVRETPELHWARNFFFSFEIRGTKNRVGSAHPAPEQAVADDVGTVDPTQPRVKAVEKMLENLDTTKFQHNCWFLDFATRVTVSDDQDDPSACTLPITSMHAHLFEHFSGLDWETCVSHIERTNGPYQRDEVAHLNDISGGRLVIRDGQGGVFYIQIYTTDKSVTYNIDCPHNAQRTSGRSMVQRFDTELDQFIDPLIRAFGNSAQSHGVALRIESRVEYFSYPYCHLGVPNELIRRCIYRMERHVFWGWKMARLVSMRAVMQEWIAARHRFNLSQLPESGTLLLIMEWMMNALVNRPDEGSNWDKVRDAACVHRMVGDRLVPYRPLGAVFLPKIRFKNDKQPRVSSLRCIPIATICYLMSLPKDKVSEYDLYTRITEAKQKRPRQEEEGLQVTSAPRHANKQRRVNVMSSETPEDLFSHVMPQLEREGYSSEEEDPEEREAPSDNAKVLTQLVHSYPIQIIAKAPNRSGSGSWCRLTSQERLAVKFDMFCTVDQLNAAFESYILLTDDLEKWQRTINVLFPMVEDSHIPYQGVSTLGARKQYIHMLERLPVTEQKRLVEYVRDCVSRKWVWLPYGLAKGHLWCTGKAPRHARQVGGTPGGPWIVWNPAFPKPAPTPNV